MMLDEVIEYFETEVKKNNSLVMPYESRKKYSDDCKQMAEWLRELQIYRQKLTEIEEAVNFYKSCESCQGFREYPTDEFIKDLVEILGGKR